MEEVIRSMERGEARAFAKMHVYVVNFEARLKHPRRFVYVGCNSTLLSGRICQKSLDAAQPCAHNPRVTGTADFYRFNIFLVDANAGGEPLKASIFDGAETLLGVPAFELQQWSAPEQDQYVNDCILRMPKCEVVIRVNNGSAIVHSLRFCNSRAPPATQTYSPRHVQMPSPGTGASSSSTSKRRSVEKRIQKSDIQTTLARLVQLFDENDLGSDDE